ncbi:Calmodulin [Hondaea fermentalgiana]|uniref:Calmodulin n=1 Tax=Hondaea fermentalgiana TaxID=2315210 RepID=A0A2R5GZL3_9STRA|nr:Calmodulin [Hondaea fermentalgiana]|eukprot:GBG33484.1 Calmodulin [Hondaea fermentalgiana]
MGDGKADSEFARMAKEFRAAAGPDEQEDGGGQDSNGAEHEFVLGARVEAKVDGWSTFYKGVIVRVNKDGTFAVDFDDGESIDVVQAGQMRVLACENKVKPGQRVRVSLAVWNGQAFEGIVKAVKGPGACEIHFDDGEKVEYVPIDFVQPLQETSKGGNGPLPSSKFARGDKVSAQLDGWDQEYEGIVDGCSGSGVYKVLFDDGEIVDTVAEAQLKEVKTFQTFSPEDRIEAKLAGWDKFYGGKVVAAVGRSGYECHFDDGEHVPLVPSDLLRKARPKLFPSGTRVLAKIPAWKEAYPGTIQSANLNGTYQILFDDGECQDSVLHEDVKKLAQDSTTQQEKQERQEKQGRQTENQPVSASKPTSAKFAVNQCIEAKIPEWSQFYTGTILGANSDGTYCVSFEDGEMVPALEAKYMRTVEASTKWQKGSRVEVQIPEWDQHYPGTIEKANEDGTYHVVFDDGDVVKNAKSTQMRAPAQQAEKPTKKPESAWKVGARVEVQIPEWDQHYPGTIKTAHDDGTFHVFFDDGDVVEHAKPEQMKAPAQQAEKSTSKPESAWKVGARVEVQIPEWDQHYPGTIKTAHDDGTFHVFFDDGDVVEHAKPEQMKAPAQQAEKPAKKPESAWKVGARVEVQIPEWDQHYPGTVKNVNADGTYHVVFDDGDVVEHAKPEQMRALAQQAVKSAKKPETAWKVGARVEVQIPEWDQHYPGTIKTAHGDGTFHVVFDDGDVVEHAKPEQMRALAQQAVKSAKKPETAWKVGARVEVQIPEWDQHYPGTIKTAHGDGTFHVVFDDGDVVKNAKPEQMKTPSVDVNSTSEREVPEVHLGDRVQAKLDTWKRAYKGVVTAIGSANTMTINFDDGEVARDVEKGKISEVLSTALNAYKKGDRVIGHLPGWAQPYHGEVQKIAGRGSCTVKFEDGEIIEFFPCELMHPDLAAQPTAKAEAASPEVEMATASANAEKQTKASNLTPATGADMSSSTEKEIASTSNPTNNFESPDIPISCGDESMAPSQSGEAEHNACTKEVVSRGHAIEITPGVASLNKEKVKAKSEINVVEELKTDESAAYELEPSENKVQVFLCMLRGTVSRKMRQKDGSIDPERVLRIFRKHSQRRDDAIDLAGFRRGIEALRINSASDRLLRSVLLRVDNEFLKQKTVSFDALRNYFLFQTPTPDSLEGRIRALIGRGADLARAFRKFDLDGSGKVSATELCRVFSEACGGDELSLEAAHSIIAQFDADGDRELDESEFMRFAMPDFGIVVNTPLGEFFAPIDPCATIASLRTDLPKRAGLVLGPEIREHFGGRSVQLARDGGTQVLEPPHVKSAMLCAEVLQHEETIWLLPHARGRQSLTQKRHSNVSRRSMSSSASAKSLDARDREVSIARQRLEQMFAFLEIPTDGKIKQDALVKAVRGKPQIRKLLSGSALLAPLREHPAKVFASMGKEAVSCSALMRFLIPQRKVNAAESSERDSISATTIAATAALKKRATVGVAGSKNKKKENQWANLKKQAAVAREFVARYKDTGAQELAAHFEETLGAETVAALSQDARARLWEPREAPIDMRIDPNIRVNEAGERLYGQSPTETQQWVNALSSDKWLGLQSDKKSSRSKRGGLAMCEAYSRAADLPTDPSTWNAHDVRQWVQRKLELPSLASAFETLTGKHLLAILEEEELPEGITGNLHRRKILAHLDQLREIYHILRSRRNPRALSQDLPEWCVADVLEWLSQSLGAPREVQRAFRARSIDGCLLASLSAQELVTEVGLDKDWAAKVHGAVEALGPFGLYDRAKSSHANNSSGGGNRASLEGPDELQSMHCAKIESSPSFKKRHATVWKT